MSLRQKSEELLMNMTLFKEKKEGKESFVCSRILLKLYQLQRNEGYRWPIRYLVLKLEGGEIYSVTIRKIFRYFHGVNIGLYTYGPLKYAPKNFAPGTTIGRYCSIYFTVRRFNLNHTMNTKSTHPFFSAPHLGKVETGFDLESKLVIGNDVWIGHNATLLNTVETIGDGAVIGAGAVVATNVPPYAVATGYPARVVRYRFTEKTIRRLLEEKWWLKSIDELSSEIEDFRKPLEVDGPIR